MPKHLQDQGLEQAKQLKSRNGHPRGLPSDPKHSASGRLRENSPKSQLLAYPENHRCFGGCWRNASGSKEQCCLTPSNCEDFC